MGWYTARDLGDVSVPQELPRRVRVNSTVAVFCWVLASQAAMASAALDGSWFTPVGVQNLTVLGIADWAHWGLNSNVSFDHKATGSSQISNYTVVNGQAGSEASFRGAPAGYSWTDGAPTPAIANTTSGVYISGGGKGFQITVPADATARAVTIYVGLYSTQGRLVAHLSDNSASDYIDTSLSAVSSSVQRAYTVLYQAASAGQTLTLTFANAGSGGNVNLQAAALAGSVSPDFTLTGQAVTSTVTPGNSASYTVTVGALNGFTGVVGLDASGLPEGAMATFVPPTITGAGSSTLTVTTTAGTTPPGSSTLTLTGTSGVLTHAMPVSLTVNLPGSSPFLTGTWLTPVGTQNLTALGASDWAHWGLIPVPSFDHKATGATQITDYTVVNGEAGMVVSYNNNPFGFTWNDGAQHGATTNTTTGVYINGANRGFRIRVPADATERTVTAYVGLYATQGKLTAHLSDNSAPDYVDTSLNSTGSVPRAYTINFRAASAGQTLTLTFVNAGSSGNVNLQAATINIGPTLPPAPDFSISTQPGSQTVIAGASTTYTVSTTALNGYGGVITLSASGLPSGATASFSPTTITGSGSSTLTVTTTGTTALGNSTLTITGTDGSLSHGAQVSLIVNPLPMPDFSISAQPGSQTLLGGAAATYALSTAALNGYGGVITLSASGLPSGATASFMPGTVTGSGPAILTVTTTSGSTPGSFLITITGTDGPLLHTTTVSLTVNPPGSSSAILNGAWLIPSGTQDLTALGSSDWAHWGLISGSSFDHMSTGLSQISNYTVINGEAGNVARFTGNPFGFNWTQGIPDSVGSGTTTGVYVSGANRGFQITVPADATTRTVTIYLGLYSASGKLVAHLSDGSAADYIDSSLSSTGSTQRAWTFTYRANSSGKRLVLTFTNTSSSGNVNLQAAALSVGSTPPSFSLSAQPPTQTVPQTLSAAYTVSVAAQSGFSGATTLSVLGLPPGAAASFAPATINGSSSSTLTITTSLATPVGGSYNISISGWDGSMEQDTQVALVIGPPPPPDFSLSVQPVSRVLAAGNSTTYTVSTTALYAFNGSIALSVSGAPSDVIASFSTPAINGSGTSILTLASTAATGLGTFTVTVTGTSGTLNHSVEVALTIKPPQERLYNGIVLPSQWPPLRTPTQAYQIPPYISSPPEVIPIDLGRQLFVDDFLISSNTLQRIQHRPQMHPANPILVPGGPDTASFAMPYSDGAWYDPADKLYKMWYLGGRASGISYATSVDGVNWIKPSFPNAPVPNTNIVLTLNFRDSATVWMDLDDPNSNNKFKAFVYSPPSNLNVYFSPNGIQWTQQPFTLHSNSDRTTVFWNPFRKVWVDSMRGSTTLPPVDSSPAHFTRLRYYAESPDLLNWTPAAPTNTSFWTGPDELDPPYVPGGALPELYNLDAVAYESLLVGLFSWYNPGPSYSPSYGPGPNLVELGVGFSRDGYYWVRPTRGSNQDAFIPATNISGSWNAYNTQSVGGGFMVVGDQLWFYFSGRTLQKPASGVGSAGLATLRRDGFYSMEAGAEEGTLLTRPIQFTGNHLFVNVDDPSGQLLVEVLDQNGNVIAPFTKENCIPVRIDSTLEEVHWAGASDLSPVSGGPVQFKFYLTNGDLYSFWVTPSQLGASYGYVGSGGPGFLGTIDTIGGPAGVPASLP